MKLSYFEDTDTLYIELVGTPSTESQEVAEGVTLDLNEAGQTVGIEIEQANTRVDSSQIQMNLPFLAGGAGDRK